MPRGADRLDAADAKGTPAAVRPVAGVFLCLLSIYFVCAFAYGFAGRPWALWAEGGRWSMFTYRSTKTRFLRAEVQRSVAGPWQPIDLVELFPTMWDSGPRYGRASFHNSRRRMTVLAKSTCLRHPEQLSRVRLIQRSFRRQIGSMAPRPGTEKEDVLLTFACDKVVPLPGGRSL